MREAGPAAVRCTCHQTTACDPSIDKVLRAQRKVLGREAREELGEVAEREPEVPLLVIGVLETGDEQRRSRALFGDLGAQAGQRVQLRATVLLVEKEARAHVRCQHHEVEVFFSGQYDRLGEVPVGFLVPVGRADVAVKVSGEDLKTGAHLVRVSASRGLVVEAGELDTDGAISAGHGQIHRRVPVEVAAFHRRGKQSTDIPEVVTGPPL